MSNKIIHSINYFESLEYQRKYYLEFSELTKMDDTL